jgi:hypothetical protein
MEVQILPQTGEITSVQSRVSQDAAEIIQKLKQMQMLAQQMIGLVTFASEHSGNPYCQELISTARDKVNASLGVMSGHFMEYQPWFKHLMKSRKTHIKSGGNKQADIWVVLENDSYPGKAIQLKVTNAKDPSTLKPHLMKALKQVSGATGENPGNLRRIVEVMLWDQGVTWPFTNAYKVRSLQEFCAEAVEKVSDAYYTALNNEWKNSDKWAMAHALGRGVIPQFGQIQGAKPVRAMLANQYVEGTKKFDVVVTKILFPWGTTVQLPDQSIINIRKVVVISHLQASVRYQGTPDWYSCTIKTVLAEVKDFGGAVYTGAASNTSPSFNVYV